MTKAEVPDHLRELFAELPLTLNSDEAAKVLCMHKRTLRRMVASGELRAMRATSTGTSRVIIPRSELLRWMIEHPARAT